MYKIFDYNDEPTGIEFIVLSDAMGHLHNCAEGYYIYDSYTGNVFDLIDSDAIQPWGSPDDNSQY